jgi:hypothetical protein
MVYNCPLPTLTAHEDPANPEAPQRLSLERCGAILTVDVGNPGGWQVHDDGTNAGELEAGSAQVRCIEGHVLLTVYNDTNTDVAPITEDFVQQAVEWVTDDLDILKHPDLAKCPHCGEIGTRGLLIWHEPGCWWLKHGTPALDAREPSAG